MGNKGASHQLTQISVTNAIKNLKHGPKHLHPALTSWTGFLD